MIIKRYDLIKVNFVIEKIKSKIFDIYTQYNFLKLQDCIKKEMDIYIEQRSTLIKKYANYNENNEIIIKDDKTIEINPKYINECRLAFQQMEELEIQIPDIYFSLDELKDLELNFEELSLLKPFIK